MNEQELRDRSITIALNFNSSENIEQLLSDANKVYGYIMKDGRPDIPISQLINDPFAFIARLKIQHPVRGTIPFNLYDHQKRLLQYLFRPKHIIINSARQMGVSSLLVRYAFYEASQQENQTILMTSGKWNQAAQFLVSLGKNLPAVSEISNSHVLLKNGSKIICRTMLNDDLRPNVSHIIIDNAAFISHKTFYESIEWINAISNKTKIIMASSPNDCKGVFYDRWHGDDQSWLKIALPWYEHSERDEEWANFIRNPIGEPRFRKDYCCEFSPTL